MEKIELKESNKIIEEKSDLKNYDVLTRPYNPLIEDIINTQRLVIQPYFQRHYVWNIEKKSNLIDTILTGMPLPAIYTYLDIPTNKEYVIDGQQRLMTIKKFINNEFKLKNLQNYSFLNDLDYFSLPQKYKNKISNFILTIIKITNVNNTDIVFDIFQKYNSGSVQLNRQEIRNCIFSGKHNDLVKQLTQYSPFSSLFKFREIDRMEKEEYVLRFFALSENFNKYNGNMNEFLDNYCSAKKTLEDLTPEEFETKNRNLVKNFKKSVDACIEVFGINAYKNCAKSKHSQNILYKTTTRAVFDMQMLGFADFDFDLIKRHKDAIKERYEYLVLNDESMRPFYKKMSKKAVEYRIENWKKEVAKIISKP